MDQEHEHTPEQTQPEPEQPAQIRVEIALSETTWLENITKVEGRPTPDGRGKILMYTLANGHRYAIPLFGDALAHTQRIVSPVVISTELPGQNGHGA